MIKKGKYFVPPADDGSTFKVLFIRLAAAGAGRPVGPDGFPAGPWTPDLLATAISQFDGNRSGIELRTVQLWFQENERGVSAQNIRWLARVFGCDDQTATAEWQVILSAALAAQKREKRAKQQRRSARDIAPKPLPAPLIAPDILPKPSEAPVQATREGRPEKRKFSLARASEALFSHGSPIDLPASVFAGAVGLGFLALIIGVHNVTYEYGGLDKQVGYWWAPNWTVLFLVLLPLFLGFIVETLLFWKREGRPLILSHCELTHQFKPWPEVVEKSKFTFWAVFLICTVFAGVIQWIGVRLEPLLSGKNDYATDWGTVALLRPDEISVKESIFFTALTYVYMSLCFYLLFVGLILLYKIINDCGKMLDRLDGESFQFPEDEKRRLRAAIMKCAYRCLLLVVLIATAMNLQDRYLASNGTTIVSWLLLDINAVTNLSDHTGSYLNVTLPNQFSSMIVILATLFVFVYGTVRLKFYADNKKLFSMMMTVLFILFAAYILVGSFVGWVMLMGCATILAAYALFDPEFDFILKKSSREKLNAS
ncbi:hypothetical protein QCN27_15980 [Cereibacter sp. SYSU M97828]|nr:hypothetical protein [Cereibacter flavus]